MAPEIMPNKTVPHAARLRMAQQSRTVRSAKVNVAVRRASADISCTRLIRSFTGRGVATRSSCSCRSTRQPLTHAPVSLAARGYPLTLLCPQGISPEA